MKREKLSTEELQEIWKDDADGEYVQINDDGQAHYIAHGCCMEEIQPAYGNLFAGIRQWMKAKGYYPNIWSVNERGNVEMMDWHGNGLGGLV